MHSANRTEPMSKSTPRTMSWAALELRAWRHSRVNNLRQIETRDYYCAYWAARIIAGAY